MQQFIYEQAFDVGNIVMPLVILQVADDQDRAFLTDAYIQYRKLMYKTASYYFKQDTMEIEEAVSASTERICKYCKNFQAIPCNKRAAYVVRLVENVCRTRYRVLALQKSMHFYAYDEEMLDQIPSDDNVQETVFSHICADELIASFDQLSARDRELIQMRHVDHMDFSEIAEALHMKEGAVRTALTRAKKRLEKMGLDQEA